ncbi:endonuclease/exonuclease/phosphatase family protein [Solirhodobacter olei]|uniref:endonuclease/exonuclease/phosphatase family protein n=1 Tax=Solirhodobacter olei TaxID=2493082 RepID=UPI000FD8FF75|nr:endonuclease/exonuclease/phosphatase family protein [Solirhodobacter olei]
MRPLPAPADGLLRVASWNIRKCLGIDRRRDPDRTLRVITATGADIVALQESDRRLGPRPAALPASLISAASEYRALPLGQSEVSLGWHGNAILVRPSLELVGVHKLDLPSFEPRGAVAADLRRNGTELRIVGVHLGLRGTDRLRQLGRLVDWLDRQPRMPTLILGDFNEWSPDAPLEPLRAGYRVLAPGPSYHARLRLAPLDRIAHSPGVSVRATGLMDHGDAARASDHLPIWADVSFAP